MQTLLPIIIIAIVAIALVAWVFAVSAALKAGTLVRLDVAVPDLWLRLVWRGDREWLPGLRDLLYATIPEPRVSV